MLRAPELSGERSDRDDGLNVSAEKKMISSTTTTLPVFAPATTPSLAVIEESSSTMATEDH